MSDFYQLFAFGHALSLTVLSGTSMDVVRQKNHTYSLVSTSCVVRAEGAVVTVIIISAVTVKVFQLSNPDGYHLSFEWLPTGT